MKKAFFIFTFIATAMAAAAQTQVIRVHSGNNILLQKDVAEMDSIKSIGGNLHLYYSGGSQAFQLSAIDSISFAYIQSGTDSTDVDTSSCVRITWAGGSVSIENPYSSNGLTVTADGQNVSAVSTAGIADIVYILKGSTTNGSFKLTTDKKYTLVLDGVSITSSDRQAIYVASDYRGIIHLEDATVNSLTDNASSGGKGALQSKGRFIFQGGGVLNVTGNAKHGIQSSGSTTINNGEINILGAVKDGMNVDNFIINGGTVNVTATGDGIDGDQGYIDISGGQVTISCGSADVKGLCCDSTLTISGGNISVTVTGDQSKAIKTKENLVISGGTIDVNANGSVVLETAGQGYDPSYCTGIKTGGLFRMFDGDLTVTCPSTNSGGKAISCDGSIFISGGILDLNAIGACVKYTDSTGTFDNYSSTCLKSDADITISGGIVNATAGGRAISADGRYTQTGGIVTTSTSANGFTTIGSGTSCTDGFAPACLKSDGNATFAAGRFSGISTGTGGRGIVGDSVICFGTSGMTDSLLVVTVKTSGAAVNATGGGGWPGGGGSNSNQWKGLPKGIKADGNIVVLGGYLQSFCAQTSGDPTGEALETKDSLLVSGGYIETNAYDDAINAANHIRIDSGHVWAYARGNDGIDCNGNNIYINGGVLIAYGTECAIDDNADNGGTHLFISNATVIAIGGNMGAIEGTPSLTGQKYLTIGSSGGGPGGGGPGGGGNALNTAKNGFCIKDNDGNEVLTYKWNNITNGNSGFESTGSKRVNGILVTSPDITGTTYRYFTSPTITGGTNWHGLYDGATVTTSGNGTQVTAH